MKLEDLYLQSLADEYYDQGPEALPVEFQNTEGVSPGEMARGVMDTAAVGLKGMTQGSVGMPGDIEGLIRTVAHEIGLPIDEKTILPTAEEVKAFFDKYLQIKPEQTPTMSDADRKLAESIGEAVSPAGPIAGAKGATKVIKRAIKGGKK